jgi:penicillin-binding protein 1A
VGFDTAAFPQELGLALGQAEVTPLEMAQLSALIANGGLRVQGSTVVRAVDGAGKEVLALPKSERVLSAQAAALTRDLMRLVIDYGTGGAIRGVAGEAGYAGPAMGKTGTTDSEKDLWFVGATPKTAVVVWLGYDQPVRVGASAADLAAPLWGWWVGRSTRVDGLPLPDFSAQPTVVKKPICTVTGKLPNETCTVINAPFLPGTAPKVLCPTTHPPAVPIEQMPGHESLWKRKAREAAEAGAEP